jgi:N-acetylglucosaminyldiphosphoundecaprenol N-acetyl-beta-D-mannosaminyltransferase
VAIFPVCSIPIAALGPEEAAEAIVEAGLRRSSFEVHLCNAYTLSLVDYDETLRNALAHADLNLADGTPVARIGRRHGSPGPVRGPGLVGDVARAGVKYSLSHYLYGGAQGVADSMAERLKEHAPGLHVVGTECPPFRELTDAELDVVARRIDESRAHVVWIGLGTPKQDYLVPRLASRVSAAVVPVGAAFDFWAGTVDEAPEWLHGSGLEWMHRLASEPRRLWRRYLIGNPRFLWSALLHSRRTR